MSADRTRRIAGTDLDVSTLCLGGNVFGWTANAEESELVLDAYVAAGGNFIDTADAYSYFQGTPGGDSEKVLGDWLTSRGNRSDVILATKVGAMPARTGASAANVLAAADESLDRLRTDYVDVYFIHYDDPTVPVEETLGALNQLVDAGKVRYIAASNFTAPRLAESLAVSDRNGWPRYVALQSHYNLAFRDLYEGELQELCAREGIGCMPYFALGAGFLTGKYRSAEDAAGSIRATMASKYATPENFDVLDTLRDLADARGCSMSTLAVAWLMAQPTVLAPVASARNLEQLDDLLAAMDIELTAEERERLDLRPAPAPPA